MNTALIPVLSNWIYYFFVVVFTVAGVVAAVVMFAHMLRKPMGGE